MTATEQLKSILSENYVSEDGDEYKVELLPGLTDQELEILAKKVPTGKIPNDIQELLKFASGFEFNGLEKVTFNGIGQFGFEELFPNSVQLTGDGFGNFWILDIDQNGYWGHVFYICHDPAVVVKHSDNLSEFIKHVDDFGKNGSTSHLDIVHEKSVMDIWQDKDGFIELDKARQSNDAILKQFASAIAGNFVIADLRGKPNNYGFAWEKFGGRIENAERHKSELLWAIEKPERKRGILSKIFGR